ncbi:11012_t:CDS:2 [Diversispora eburnea]|uniref:JmjC domain-containing histone demethylation protein 1 n=1 Tax=Diversispora eburnea TaxID=1213867 RepID=A0A9N8WR79_9GLOM|nr:11012_t:CDS:2 [Diversispora eburnea]
MSKQSGSGTPHEKCPLCTNEPRSMPLWFQENTETWIKCDICLVWCHTSCLKLPPDECDRIDEYHCPECSKGHGPSTYKVRKSLREHSRVNYADLDNGLTGNPYKWKRVIDTKTFSRPKFPKIRGEHLTLDWVQWHGLEEPIIIEKPDGLDMKMPPRDITVSNIAEAVAMPNSSYKLSRSLIRKCPIDVSTQQEQPDWNMYKWAAYYDGPKHNQVLNVISLEISGTPLGDSIVRPRIVRELDWTDNVWPAEMKKLEYPKVQLYCLMSLKDSFTDFHIDFGGTSVFYHVLKGEKVFYFVRPTSPNLKRYARWISSPEQSMTFFADLAKDCYEVHLVAGNTMIIPTGWIHAVYTPEDSIVIGGNFLHGFNIGGQLAVYDIEKRTNVPLKYRFPYFEKMCWFAGKKYYEILKENPKCLSTWEEKGIVELAIFLSELSRKLDSDSETSSQERQIIKSNIPEEIHNHSKLARRLCRKINDHISNSRFGESEFDSVFIPDISKKSVKTKRNVIRLRDPNIGISKSTPPNDEILNNEIPNVEIPNIEIPNIEIPNIEIPNIEIPNTEIPNDELSKSTPPNNMNPPPPKNLRIRIVSRKRNRSNTETKEQEKTNDDDIKVNIVEPMVKRRSNTDKKYNINNDLTSKHIQKNKILEKELFSPSTPRSDSTISSWNDAEM